MAVGTLSWRISLGLCHESALLMLMSSSTADLWIGVKMGRFEEECASDLQATDTFSLGLGQHE